VTIDPIRLVLVALFVLLPVLGYVKGCTDEKGRFDDFKTAQAAIAQAQEAHTKQVIVEQKTAKEKADAENAAAHAALDSERLRKQRTRTIILPTPTACPGGTAPADRSEPERQRAYRELVSGLRSEADRCSKAITDLNSAKKWAQSP
jgi:hypothetical protein